MKQKLLFLLMALLLPAGAMAQFAWYGVNGKAQVVTGLGNGSNTEGLWWWTNPDGEGGDSKVVWDVEPGEDGSFDNLVKACGGISGTAVLDQGKVTYNPYVEVGFNVVGEDINAYVSDWDANFSAFGGRSLAGDASAWGGIAISYSSDVALGIELGFRFDDDGDIISSCLPYVYVPKAPEGNFVRIPWSEFKQAAWIRDNEYKISGLGAAKKLVNVMIKVQAKPGSYHFNIKAIGSYDMDETPVLPEKCATPTIAFVGGKLKFSCETEGVTYDYDITDDDIKSGSGDEVPLCATYNVSVYAKKFGYNNSDVATGTLCWIDATLQTEGIVNEDAVTEVAAVPVLIQSEGGTISVQGAAAGTPIAVYDLEGREYGFAVAEKDRAVIPTSLRTGSTAIVKIGGKAVKVLVK